LPLTDLPAAKEAPEVRATVSVRNENAVSSSERDETVVEQEKSPSASLSGNKLNRPPKSTSLKELAHTKTEDAGMPLTVEGESEQETVPLDAENLIRCWDAYAETIDMKIHLKNTMLSCKPVLQENARFEVVVHNSIQKEELISSSPPLLNVLRGQLKNNQIQMLIRVDEANEKKLAYTSIEKYEFFSQINPLLARLKDEFDLTID
jgi:DNA polymerase-3 subunit gamma/tau